MNFVELKNEELVDICGEEKIADTWKDLKYVYKDIRDHAGDIKDFAVGFWDGLTD